MPIHVASPPIRVTALIALASLALASCGGSGAATGTRASDTAVTSGSRSVTTVTRTATVSSATGAVPSNPTSATTGAPPSNGGVPVSGGTGTSAGGGPPPCRAAGLSLSSLGQQGATGHGELGFALRNTGSSSCSTIGYPGIQFLDRSGAALPTVPTHTTHDFFGSAPLRGLVVGAGQTVSFRLGVTHGIGSGAGCTTAYGLQVIPPNDTASLRVTIPDGGAAECGTATVSPLRPGAGAYP